MITHFLAGGLGNQLFQIYATISLSIKLGDNFTFSSVKCLGTGLETIRYTYWESFFINLNKSLDKITSERVSHIIEKNHNYSSIDVKCSNNNDLIILHGYFQSYKYFKEEQNKISSMIGIETQKKNIIDNNEFGIYTNSVSIHFRIGDYINNTSYHPILTDDFYMKSLEYVSQSLNDTNLKVFYFCEENDIVQVENTVDLLRSEYKNMCFTHIDSKIPDWKQMLIMSLCNHNIIANSTFSLWAGYFNTNPSKIVCYPSTWFGKDVPHVTDDMFPVEWVKILI